MSTEFISMLPPPGKALGPYDNTLPHDQQVPSIPATFIEAMSVREAVYVGEQNVPLQNEFDMDDHRSFHWVTYASVGSSSSGSASSRTKRNSSTASRLAVAAIRIVPPPHPPHDHEATTEHRTVEADANTFNPGNEPYVKIGRLSTLKAFRGLGLARLLVESALDWISSHPDQVHGPERRTSVVGREAAHLTTGAGVTHNGSVSQARSRSRSGSGASRGSGAADKDVELEDGEDAWSGLVLAHAQIQLEKFWGSFGFVRDESMGVWDEEGIQHIAMWKRLEVSKSKH